jgi:voltage-gated potassium channel
VDTLYMTVITITTVGFNEVIDLSGNPGGRIFTMFIVISGVGIMGYIAVNSIGMFVEGELTKSFRRTRMNKVVNKYEGHAIVCGFGTIGAYIAAELHGAKRPYVIVEIDKELLEKALLMSPDQIVIEGDATDSETLIKAGIERAKGVFAVAGDDNQNLVVSLTAKQINPRVRVVAHCLDVKNEEKMKRAGADAVVSPRFIGSLRMTAEMVRPNAVSFLDMMLREKEKDLQIEEISLPDSFVGKALLNLDLKRYPETLILAIRAKDGWIYNPSRAYLVRSGDILVYISTPEGTIKLDEAIHSVK